MHFITEPLDIRLISSSFRSSFFATICLFVVIDFVFRLQNYTIQTIPPNFFPLFFWIKHFLPFLDPVHHAVGLAVALELAFGAVEEVTYFNIGTFVLGIGALEHLF